MSDSRVTIRTVELTAAGGAAPSARVWDAPCGAPFQNVNIYLSTRGLVTAAGNLTWQVFYGGNWAGGTPFDSAATHAGGVSQSGPTAIGGGTEIAHRIYTDNNILPVNLRSVRPSPSGEDIGLGG